MRYCFVLMVMLITFSAQPLYANDQTEFNDIVTLKKSLRLGHVHFKVTTNNNAAKEHFLLGATFLHAFMYDLAIVQFQAAQKLDPGFAMSYWGEAMSYKHPLWNYEDLPAAQKVLAHYNAHKDKRQLNKKEKKYLQAVTILFSTTSQALRDEAYLNFMHSFYNQFPDDPNIGSFYALSLLGVASDFPNNPDVKQYLQQGMILITQLFNQFPSHPGVVHYYLHYHDNEDKVTAIKALPAAKIALDLMSSSSHVTHMAAHIYRRLGLWEHYIKSNKISLDAADKLCRQLDDQPLYACNAENKYHSLEWLHDGYLKTKQYDKAKELVHRMANVVAKDQGIIYLQWYYRMWARQLLITKDWSIKPITVLPISKNDGDLYWSAYSECGALQASSFLKLHHGSKISAELTRLEQVIRDTNTLSDPYIYQSCHIAQLEIKAEEARIKGKKNSAPALLKKAIKIQHAQISTELTPSLSFLTADQYKQLYFCKISNS